MIKKPFWYLIPAFRAFLFPVEKLLVNTYLVPLCLLLAKPLLVNRDEGKKLEIRFSNGSEIAVFLRLEGNRLEKYGPILVNLLSPLFSQEVLHQNSEVYSNSLDKIGKKLKDDGVIFEVLQKQGETSSNILKVIREFRNIDFSSKDIKRRFEERIGKPIQLSMVATYLLRLYDKGLLMRRKRGKEYVYQAAQILLQNE